MMNELATIYEIQNDFNNAKSILNECLTIEKQTFELNHKIAIVTLQILIRVSIALNENKTIIDDLQAQMISIATMIYGDSSLFACEIQCTEHDHVLKKIVCEYQDSSFDCDLCNKNGEGWSYNCKICSFDTHLECIRKVK